jgi:hypothetical protein
MLRKSILILLLTLACGKVFAEIGVELDVVFNDSTVQCRYLYVLSPNAAGTNDTLAVFDTLSFNGQNRVSLFYTVGSEEKNILALVDSDGLHIKSNSFGISPQHTAFVVHVGQQQIKVAAKDYLYPLKNEDERSYFVFLLIYFVVKIVISAIFIFSSKLPKRLIFIASGAFLLSAFVDWFLPIHYLYRFAAAALAEYLMIATFGRKSISWLQASALVVIVNVAGYGIIAILYLMFVFC